MNRASLARTVFLIVIVGAGGIVALNMRQHHAGTSQSEKPEAMLSTDTLHTPLVPPGPQVTLLFQWKDANGELLEESLEQLIPDRGANLTIKRTLGSGSAVFSTTINLTPHVFPDNTVRLQMQGDMYFPDGSKTKIALDKTVKDGEAVTAATVIERTDTKTGQSVHAPVGRPFHTLVLIPKIDHSDDPSPRNQPRSAPP